MNLITHPALAAPCHILAKTVVRGIAACKARESLAISIGKTSVECGGIANERSPNPDHKRPPTSDAYIAIGLASSTVQPSPFSHSGAQFPDPHSVGITKQTKQTIMFSGFKLVAIVVLLFAPEVTLAGLIYRQDDAQTSLSKFHESPHLLRWY